jgi:hypothetical protein
MEKFAILRLARDFERVEVEDTCDPRPKLGILGAASLASDANRAIDLVAGQEHVCVETRPPGSFTLRLAARDRIGNAAELAVPVKTLEIPPIHECKQVDPATTATVTLAGRPISVKSGLSTREARPGRTLAIEFSEPLLIRSVRAEDKDRLPIQPHVQGYDLRGALVPMLDARTRDSLSLKALVAGDHVVQKLEVPLPDGGSVTSVTLCAPTYDRGAAISGQECGLVIEAREFGSAGHPECRARTGPWPR